MQLFAAIGVLATVFVVAYGLYKLTGDVRFKSNNKRK